MASTDTGFTPVPSPVITTIAGAGAGSVYTQSYVPRPSVAPMTGVPDDPVDAFLLSPVGPRRDLGSTMRSGNPFTPPPEGRLPGQNQDLSLREELAELKQLVTLLTRLVTQNQQNPQPAKKKAAPPGMFEMGGATSMAEHLRRFEDYFLKTYPESYDTMAEHLPMYLPQPAREYYQVLKQSYTDYEDLKYHLLRWYKEQSDYDKMMGAREFNRLHMERGETVSAFAIRLVGKAQRCFPGSSVKELAAVRERFLEGLPRSIGEVVRSDIYREEALRSAEVPWERMVALATRMERDLRTSETQVCQLEQGLEYQALETPSGRATVASVTPPMSCCPSCCSGRANGRKNPVETQTVPGWAQIEEVAVSPGCTTGRKNPFVAESVPGWAQSEEAVVEPRGSYAWAVQQGNGPRGRMPNRPPPPQQKPRNRGKPTPQEPRSPRTNATNPFTKGRDQQGKAGSSGYPEKCWECDSREHTYARCPQRPFCEWCGKRGHSHQQCYMAQGICYWCQKTGHRSSDCPTKQRTSLPPGCKCPICRGPHLGRYCPQNAGN